MIGLPPLAEQLEIVHRVKTLFTLADRLQARYAKAKYRVDRLSQALLAKAFSGELGATEAELAEAERRSFESAEELLKRVSARSTEATRKKAAHV